MSWRHARRRWRKSIVNGIAVLRSPQRTQGSSLALARAAGCFVLPAGVVSLAGPGWTTWFVVLRHGGSAVARSPPLADTKITPAVDRHSDNLFLGDRQVRQLLQGSTGLAEGTGHGGPGTGNLGRDGEAGIGLAATGDATGFSFCPSIEPRYYYRG